MLDEADIQFALRNLDQLSLEQKTLVLDLLEERERLARIEDAREHFIPFVKRVWPDFIAGAHHNIVGEAFERVARGELRRLIISMPPRFCLAVDTPVPTPTGWTTMGALQPGDEVFGPDGLPTKVVGVSPVYDDHECFVARTADGAEVVCDAGHLWNVAVDRKRPHVFKLKTAAELFARQAAASEGRRAWIPDTAPVHYADPKPLPLPPYTFGMWIGNGHKDQAIVTNDSRDLAGVRAQVEAEDIATSDQATPLTFGMLGVKRVLRGMGVLGNKHIPEAYMRASVEDRLRLLYGLFDSDGCASKAGHCTLTTTDPGLRDQYRELLWSVGIRAHLYHFRARFEGRDYGDAWTLGFYAPDFGLAGRKRAGTRATLKPVRRYISFERYPTVPVRCIEVARADGLFLAGRGFVVTHNTKSELSSVMLPAWFLGKFPRRKIIQVSNTEALAAGFGRRVRNIISGESTSDGGDPYHEIFDGVSLAKDSQAAAGWHTSKGGEYFAIGVNGKVTGKGADLAILDDLHSEQEAKQAESNPGIFDAVYEWYTSGIRQRLQPGGAIIIPMTRWSKRDIVGQVLRRMESESSTASADKWEVIELPAILDEGLPTERSMWPGYWKLEELQATRAALPVTKWKAQYQQALEVNTPIPTPSGWKTMREIQVGDEVWGSDGKPTKVVWKSEVYRDRPVYRVHSDDGSEVFADAEHLWTVKLNRADTTPQTHTTGYLAARQTAREKERPLAPRRPRLPEPVAWVLPDVSLPLDPWVLGAWLGDGNASGAIMTAHDDDAPFMRAEFERRGFTTSDQAKRQSFGVLGLRTKLRLMGQINNKHIPESYLRASYEQRLDLLRGLVDTDGTVSKGRTAFASVHKNWADKVCELVLSLGAKPFVKKFKMGKKLPNDRARKSGSVFCYKVEFYLPGSALMPRKASKMRGKKNKHGRFLRFNLYGTADTQCLRVENADGLFLAGRGALLTHNCPTSEQGAIIKREYWRRWGVNLEADLKAGRTSCPGPAHAGAWNDGRPPACKYILQSWDCAATKNDRSNYNACTTWGIFDAEDPSTGKTINHIILLSAWKARMEFPELKKRAKQFFDEDSPDTLLVENKSSGVQLIQEFRSMGMPVEDFRGSHRGTRAVPNDKVARANMVADVFASGYVWAPEMRSVEELIEECAEFPNGEFDDYVDSTVQAMIRFRAGGFIRTANDEAEDDRRPAAYRRRRFY